MHMAQRSNKNCSYYAKENYALRNTVSFNKYIRFQCIYYIATQIKSDVTGIRVSPKNG